MARVTFVLYVFLLSFFFNNNKTKYIDIVSYNSKNIFHAVIITVQDVAILSDVLQKLQISDMTVMSDIKIMQYLHSLFYHIFMSYIIVFNRF